MLINTIDAAFEYAEKPFSTIGMGITSDIFSYAMADYIMCGKFRAYQSILPSIIGHKVGAFSHLFFKDRLKNFGGYIGNVKGADFAVSLNQRQDSVLVPITAALLCSGFGAYESLIGFNGCIVSGAQSKKSRYFLLASSKDVWACRNASFCWANST
jgi:hypothetical protein